MIILSCLLASIPTQAFAGMPYAHEADFAARAAAVMEAVRRTPGRTVPAPAGAPAAAAQRAAPARPGAGLQFLTLKPFNSRTNPKWGPVLKDIVNHEAPGDSNPYDDLVTVAHETTHGTHAYLRNQMYQPGKRLNAFYVLEDRAVALPEPAMRKSDVIPFIPRSLRGSKYATYIEGQTDWDDTPLYIFDEWVAYANGGAAGVDLVQRGLWKYGRRDAVSGQIEFAAYALATAMAIQARDPEYFSKNPQFMEFVAWNMKRCMEGFRAGVQMPEFAQESQEKYYAALKGGADGESLRAFTRERFGADWAQATLGF